MLEISDLKVRVGKTPIICGVDYSIEPGEVHAIMGPNGSGKSTLAQTLAGHPAYEVESGSVRFDGSDLLAMAPEDRARAGLFISFQQPMEIPGVSNLMLMKSSLNAVRVQRGEPELDAVDFLKLIRERLPLVNMSEEMLHRSVNENFSGGEKKRNEMLQMAILEPSCAILDEIDSGLDVDALKTVAGAINHMRSAKRAMLLVTHYRRLLDYVRPDRVHIMVDGRLVKSGDHTLVDEIERNGYDAFARIN